MLDLAWNLAGGNHSRVLPMLTGIARFATIVSTKKAGMKKHIYMCSTRPGILAR
jgi:hypothetical protein